MIQNKQVNIWRGNDTPPTLYHIWFKDESQLLRYDDKLKDWVIFLDGGQVVELIKNFMDSLESLSINGYSITESPVLDGSDLLLGQDGHYIKKENNLQQATLKLDSLLTTKVYGE